jgi:hypothetical protein
MCGSDQGSDLVFLFCTNFKKMGQPMTVFEKVTPFLTFFGNCLRAGGVADGLKRRNVMSLRRLQSIYVENERYRWGCPHIVSGTPPNPYLPRAGCILAIPLWQAAAQ